MILDTNGLSAVAYGDSNVRPVLERSAELAIPVIVLGEYMYGIRSSRNRARYEHWLMNFVAVSRILVIDQGTAAVYADVRSELKVQGSPIPANDVWIAALARQHDLPLLSRDQHFDQVSGVRRVVW